MRTTKWAFLASLALGITGFMIFLGGMASVTHQCYGHLKGVECARGLQLEWFSGFFELSILLAFIVLLRRGRLLSALSPLYAFLSIASVTLMWTSRTMLTRGSFSDLVSIDHSSLDAAAAGAVMMCTANFAVILLMGYAPMWDGMLPSDIDAARPPAMGVRYGINSCSAVAVSLPPGGSAELSSAKFYDDSGSPFNPSSSSSTAEKGATNSHTAAIRPGSIALDIVAHGSGNNNSRAVPLGHGI